MFDRSLDEVLRGRLVGIVRGRAAERACLRDVGKQRERRTAGKPGSRGGPD
jgi:hypothetical protein